MATMVLQECTRWPSLIYDLLSDRERDELLDMTMVPEGVCGMALESTQRCCEAKKREDEVLLLCLPRILAAPFRPPQRRAPTPAAPAAQPAQFRILKQPKPADTPASSTRSWPLPPPPAAAPPVHPSPAAAPPGGRQGWPERLSGRDDTASSSFTNCTGLKQRCWGGFQLFPSQPPCDAPERGLCSPPACLQTPVMTLSRPACLSPFPR